MSPQRGERRIARGERAKRATPDYWGRNDRLTPAGCGDFGNASTRGCALSRSPPGYFPFAPPGRPRRYGAAGGVNVIDGSITPAATLAMTFRSRLKNNSIP